MSDLFCFGCVKIPPVIFAVSLSSACLLTRCTALLILFQPGFRLCSAHSIPTTLIRQTLTTLSQMMETVNGVLALALMYATPVVGSKSDPDPYHKLYSKREEVVNKFEGEVISMNSWSVVVKSARAAISHTESRGTFLILSRSNAADWESWMSPIWCKLPSQSAVKRSNVNAWTFICMKLSLCRLTSVVSWVSSLLWTYLIEGNLTTCNV